MLEYCWPFALLLRSARYFTGVEGKWTPLPPMLPPSSPGPCMCSLYMYKYVHRYNLCLCAWCVVSVCIVLMCVSVYTLVWASSRNEAPFAGLAVRHPLCFPRPADPLKRTQEMDLVLWFLNEQLIWLPQVLCTLKYTIYIYICETYILYI